MKYFEEFVKIPIYNFNIRIVCTDDLKEFCLKYLPNEEFSFLDFAFVMDYTKNEEEFKEDYLIVFDINNLKENIIVHEVFHITNRLLRVVGIPLDDSSEEVYAYLLDYLYNIVRLKTIKIKELYGTSSTGK